MIVVVFFFQFCDSFLLLRGSIHIRDRINKSINQRKQNECLKISGVATLQEEEALIIIIILIKVKYFK
jgi:hypothetical protein